ncbi:MAG: response regulator [Candidatus Omnitrophota bacterium]|jgi:DNA-binding response OmpR family regulator
MAKIKILIVDDEPDFLELLAMRLEEWGYEAVKAANGKDGVSAVKAQCPDVVVLDYMLPDMDGVATLKQIREVSAKVPVIMFTAYPSMDTIKEADGLGISAFIPKLSIYSEIMPSLKVAIDMSVKKGAKKK